MLKGGLLPIMFPQKHSRALSVPSLLIAFVVILIALVAGQGWLQPRITHAASMTFTVTNTNDNGIGSLRQAIMDAQGNAGTDTIRFQIGNGPQTISPTSPLPTITDPVIIDGT